MSEILAFLDACEPWKTKPNLGNIVLLIFFTRLCGAEYREDIENFRKASINIDKNGT